MELDEDFRPLMGENHNVSPVDYGGTAQDPKHGWLELNVLWSQIHGFRDQSSEVRLPPQSRGSQDGGG